MFIITDCVTDDWYRVEFNGSLNDLYDRAVWCHECGIAFSYSNSCFLFKTEEDVCSYRLTWGVE